MNTGFSWSQTIQDICKLPSKYANFTAKIPVCLHYESPF
jgi:hypothetical protein